MLMFTFECLNNEFFFIFAQTLYNNKLGMKHLNFVILSGAILFATACGDSNSAKVSEEKEVAQKVGQVYTADVASSSVNWKAYHKGGFAPRWGTIQVKTGELTIADNQLTAGDFIIDMTTIVVDSLSVTEDGKKYTDLQNHLKSADFFQVDSFPTAEFKVTSVSELDSASAVNAVEGANKTISGNLTLLGKTLNVSFPAKVTIEGDVVNVVSHFVVDRTAWNIQFGATAADPAEWMISKDIEVGFNVTAKK